MLYFYVATNENKSKALKQGDMRNLKQALRIK
jgi:hypothetical protein